MFSTLPNQCPTWSGPVGRNPVRTRPLASGAAIAPASLVGSRPASVTMRPMIAPRPPDPGTLPRGTSTDVAAGDHAADRARESLDDRPERPGQHEEQDQDEQHEVLLEVRVHLARLGREHAHQEPG